MGKAKNWENPLHPEDGLIRPETPARMPSERSLTIAVRIGYGIIIVTTLWVAWLVWRLLNNQYGSSSCSATRSRYYPPTAWCTQELSLRYWHLNSPWLIGAVIAIGIALIVVASSKRHYFYREALQGHVRDFYWFSGEHGDRYKILVRGYSRAGQIVSSWVSVSPKTYHDFKVDDLIDFRQEE